VKLSVAVVQGGASTEAEVSRASAKGVAAALEEAGHRVVRLELDVFLSESLRTGGYDVVFPAVHGALGEDGSLQGLLEVLGMPYVGSGVLASALAMDKRVARILFQRAGLPVAKGLAVTRSEGDSRTAAERARREVGARLVVKPSSHGSAIGVTRLEAAAPLDDVAKAIDAVWTIDDVALVEHFARGREMTCGVLQMEGDGAPVALPPTEILSPKDPFYTYEARYAPGRSVHVCPAELPRAAFARVQEVALGAFRAVGGRDLARVDLIVGDTPEETRQETGEGDARSGREEPQTDVVTLLEVNTLPGMTATSLFPEAAAVHGLPMPRWCDALVVRAHARGPTRRLPPLPLPL
jgi:D-alanine-D-alanine ligase